MAIDEHLPEVTGRLRQPAEQMYDVGRELGPLDRGQAQAYMLLALRHIAAKALEITCDDPSEYNYGDDPIAISFISESMYEHFIELINPIVRLTLRDARRRLHDADDFIDVVSALLKSVSLGMEIEPAYIDDVLQEAWQSLDLPHQ